MMADFCWMLKREAKALYTDLSKKNGDERSLKGKRKLYNEEFKIVVQGRCVRLFLTTDLDLACWKA